MDDLNLISLYFQRSEAAIGETEKKYGSYCQRIADNILGSHEDSEECLNDTWLRVWNSIPLNKSINFKSFLGTITRNIALSIWRRRSSEKRMSDRLRVCLDELSECLSGDEGRFSDDFAVKDAIERFLSRIDGDSKEIFLEDTGMLKA